MRLNRLDLTRYGKFTDHVIDFGKHDADKPDLHIVYGPNEAGKSTAFAAFLDLLFGIDKDTFSFLHPNPTMRIGASLGLADGAREVARIKRAKSSLLDGSDRPVSEASILGELGGLDRDSYRVMFSLDDETLETGGENILASKGDLGQLLFSASAGLASLSHTLADLRAETEGFYKYRSRKGDLAQLKTQLAALKEERARVDTLASEYAKIVEAQDRARVQCEEALAERGQTRSRINEIQRHLSALPRLAGLRTIRENLMPLAGLPDAPLGWLKELPKLQAEDIELATRAEGLEEEIAQISGQVERIVVDEAALRLEGRIDHLAEQRARHVTAEKDLPDRRLQLQEAELAISGILKRLGRANEGDPVSLVLEAPIVGALRDLIEPRSGIEASVKAAQEELSKARDQLNEARVKYEEAAGATNSGGRKREAQITVLSATITKLRGSDHAARKRTAERSRASCLDTIAERMAALRPWDGDADQLAELAIPDGGDIERWSEAIVLAQKQIDRQTEEIERLEADRRRVQVELDAISDVTGIASDKDAAGVRAEREQAWADHRRQLDDASAATFEAALRRDDIVTNTLLRHEKEFAKLHQTSEALARLEADLRHRQEVLERERAGRQTIGEEISASLRAMTPPLPENFTLDKLEAWLVRREKALEFRTNLKQAERDLQEADADIDAACKALSSGLGALGSENAPDEGFDALLAKAQSAIELETELKALRVAMQDRERDLKTRERALKKASEAEQGWQTSWAEACSACWLGDGGSSPSVAAIREILTTLADLGPVVEKRVGLADRIRKMENDQAAFAQDVTAIANELGLDVEGGEVLDLAHQITDRVQQARIAQSTKAAQMEALGEARVRQRGLAEMRAIHDKRKAEMTAFFKVTTLAEVGVNLQDIGKRAELQAQAKDAEGDILDALRLTSIDEAETALDAADREAIERELIDLEARYEDQDQRVRDLSTAQSKAADRVEAVGGDDAAARLEEKRRTVLLEIEEKAVRYLKLRVGIVAAEQALHIYRDKHRSSMMANASSAFRTISRGAYTSLTTQLDKEDEILIAVAADGGSKVASELSKGTRFQLYLALRVAGYYEFARSRSPVPFIADDIMETFDEFRAEETFRVFADMAQIGQVIYLTHHRHLCEIAKSICPGVRVHDLTAPPPQAEKMTSAA